MFCVGVARRSRLAGLVVALAGLCLAGPGAAAEQAAFSRQREWMVERQLQARDITEPAVLRAMRTVLRHEFVPPAYLREAYADRPLPIEEGQTISQPYIVALMTQLLALRGGEKVLEVGTGSGYQAAVLAEITPHVYTIEILPGLAASAAARLRRLGYTTVKVRTGDGYLGWPEAAPFEGILVTAGATHVPEPLIAQLAEGGRLVIPVGETYGVQELLLGQKKGGRFVTRPVASVRFVPLIEPRR